MEKTITETLDLLESNDPYLSQPINSARINYLGQTNHVRQPPRVQNVKDSFGAGNPNPNLWLPTSHFPKKKPLSTPKNPIKKDNQPDPFIDKFIEEIANVLSGRGEEKKDDDSETHALQEEGPEEIKDKLYSVFSKVNADKRSFLPKSSIPTTTKVNNPPAGQQQQQQQQPRFDQYSSFGSTMEKMTMLDLQSQQHPQQQQQQPEQNFHQRSASKAVFSNSHMFSPNHAHHPHTQQQRGRSAKPHHIQQRTNQPTTPPSFMNTVLNASQNTDSNLFNLVNSNYSNHHSNLAPQQQQQQQDNGVGNLYHIMNIAFLLIEEERNSYTETVNHAETQITRGRNLAASCVFTRVHGLMKKIVALRFRSWKSQTVVRRMISKAKKIADCANAQYFWGRWTVEYVQQRKKMRGFLNRMANKGVYLQLSSGFHQWKNNSVNGHVSVLRGEFLALKKQNLLLAQKYEILQKDLWAKVEGGKSEFEDRKNSTLRKAMYKFTNNQVGSAFAIRQDNAQRYKRQMEVVKRTARKWKMRSVMGCLNQWKAFWADKR